MPKTKTKKDSDKRLHLDRRVNQILAVNDGHDDDLLTTAELCAWFAVSEQWAEIGRVKGYGPPFERVGPRLIRYRRGKVIKWLDQRGRMAA